MKNFYRKHLVIFWLAVAVLAILSAWVAAVTWYGEAPMWAEMLMAMIAMPLSLFVPLGLDLLLVGMLLVALWVVLRGLRPFMRLGTWLLAAGWVCAVLLPVFGSSQLGVSNVIFGISRSEMFRPAIDEQILSVECVLLPGGGLQPGITASLHNGSTETQSYRIGLITYWTLDAEGGDPPASPNQTFTSEAIPVTIASGETQRLSWPLGTVLTNPLVIAQVYGSPDRPVIAFCSAIYGSRQMLIALGLIFGLAGLICLAVGMYRGRRV